MHPGTHPLPEMEYDEGGDFWDLVEYLDTLRERGVEAVLPDAPPGSAGAHDVREARRARKR